nr:Lrp/AsnC family transcriptional regulator [uncultured Holophaga sp.]
MSKPLLNDELNRRLVAALLKEGRLSHAVLASRLGISRPTLIERVKRLETEGLIEGYCARISPASVGKPLVTYVNLRYDEAADAAAELPFLQALEQEPDVLEAHAITGDWQLMVKLVADSPAGLQERLRRIRSLGPSVETDTTLVLQTLFAKAGPVPAEPTGSKARKK